MTDRRRTGHEAGGRGDGHEAGDDAGGGAEVGEVTVTNPLDDTQARPAAAAARNVLVKACAAWPLAASAEPALKPNQPNQRMPVPIITSGIECGGCSARLPLRCPAPARRPAPRCRR